MYERTRRNLNFQRRSNNYAKLLVIYQRPNPLIVNGKVNKAAEAIINRMAAYTNAKKGTHYSTGYRNARTLYHLAVNYKKLLNNNIGLYRHAGKSARYSPTRGYVWNHPGMAAQLQKTLNRVRTRPERIKRYTEALRYASNYEKAKKRFNSMSRT